MKKIPGCALLFMLLAAGLSGQTKPRPTSFIETRQGNQPDSADVIGHGTVFKADTLQCTLAEVYDQSHSSSTACMIRFGDGPAQKLAFNESMPAPQDGEVYLECAGDKPRRCMVRVD